MCLAVVLQCRWVSETLITVIAVVSLLVTQFKVSSSYVSFQVTWVSEYLGTMHAIKAWNFEGWIVGLHVIAKDTPGHKLFLTNLTGEIQLFGV